MTQITETIEQWTARGQELAKNHRHVMFDIAEWMRDGVRKYGDAAQAIAVDTFLKHPQQIRKAMDVAERFPPDRRRPELSFGHHATVMSLDDDQADSVLDNAVVERMSVNNTKKAVAAIRESEGGDIFAQMAKVSLSELEDNWIGKMIRLSNHAPSQRIRDDFVATLSEANNGLIVQ